MYNGRRITKARSARGISQTELAGILKIAHSTLNFIENDKLEFKEELAIQVGNALRFPVEFFRKKTSFTRISKFYYRKRNAFPSKEIVPLEARIDIMRDIYTDLLQAVDINFNDLPKIPVTEKNSPEEIAKNLRLFLGLDDNPIENPISLIERLGIPVIYLDVKSDKFSGMTIQTDLNMPFIVVNKNMPNDRIKHTIFHEIGHVIMHIPFSEDPEFYDKLSHPEALEKEADWFAGAFLVPEVSARYTFSPVTYSNLTNLKIYWKVSKQSLIIRAWQLGLISDSKYETLFRELSRFNERKKEKLEISIDSPVLFKKIVEYYEKNLNMGTKEIAEHIGGIQEKDFIEWFDLPRQRMIVLN